MGVSYDRLKARVAELESDATIWRHIAQERYSEFRRQCDPKEVGYPIEGALDALFRAYKSHGKFHHVFCSQCGCEFGPDYHGYSHCEDHEVPAAQRKEKDK